MKKSLSAWLIPLGAGAMTAVILKLFAVFPMMPAQASREAVIIDEAFRGCVALTVVIFCLVIAAVIYMLIRFRSSDPQAQGPAIHHSRRWWLESAWIGVSLILTIGLAAYGWTTLRTVYGAPEADLDIEVRAEQFSWEFYYPSLKQVASRLYLPLGKRTRISLTSKDVIHSFWVPEFRMKQDAVPGKITTLMLTPSQIGSYTLLCNQLCGRDHTIMTALVEVVGEEEFEKKFTAGGEAW
jgi:cytochrome c oxidase subunit 2